MTDKPPKEAAPEPPPPDLTAVRGLAVICVGVVASEPDDPAHGGIVIEHKVDPAIMSLPRTGAKLRQEWDIYNSVCDWAYKRMAIMAQKNGTLMKLNGIIK